MNLIFAILIVIQYLIYLLGGLEAEKLIITALVFLVLIEGRRADR